MAVKCWGATSHTGGGTGALDKYDGDDLTDGDVAMVVVEGKVTDTYVLDASSSASESYPSVIAPDTNPGTKRWIRQEDNRDHFLYSRKASADTLDDEFESTTLDVKWTAVGPSSGTVDLLETGTSTNRYDLTTRPGWLLLQAGLSQVCSLRQDVTLGDGDCVTIAMSAGMGHDASIANNQAKAGIVLNDNDTSYSSGNYTEFYLDTDSGESAIKTWNGSSAVGVSSPGVIYGQLIFLRVVRDSLTYRCFYSYDGLTWCGMAANTESSAYTNIWIYSHTAGAETPFGIVAFKWIRQGSGGFDPWPL